MIGRIEDKFVVNNNNNIDNECEHYQEIMDLHDKDVVSVLVETADS